MLYRPHIITRRAALIGSAALAMAPRFARAGNASGFDSGNKGANITLSNHFYYGNSTVAKKTAGGANFEAVKHSASLSGKQILEIRHGLLSGGVLASSLSGLGNASTSLSSFIGATANSIGFGGNTAGAATAVYKGGSNLGSGAPGVGQGGNVLIASDKTNSRVSWSTDGGVTWYKSTGTVDPTTGGDDFSSITGTIGGWSSVYNDNVSAAIVNNGAWPFLLGSGASLPSGFSAVETAVPIPTATISFTSLNSDLYAESNNMRVRVGTASGGSWRTAKLNKTLINNQKGLLDYVFEGADWDNIASTGSVRIGLLSASADPATAQYNAILQPNGDWQVTTNTNGTGGTSGNLGTTWNPALDVVTLAIDVGNTMKISVNAGSFSSTIDISPLSGLSLVPIVQLYVSTKRAAVSVNAGAATQQTTLSGYVPLEQLTGGGARSRAVIFQ